MFLFFFFLFFPRKPQVFVLSGVIAMVTCAVFLRLNSLLKLAVLLLAVTVYSYLIHLAFFALAHQDALHRLAVLVCFFSVCATLICLHAVFSNTKDVH